MKILIFLTGLLLAGCHTFANHDELLIRAMIFPTGTMNDTYYIEINKKGCLTISFGERKNDNINEVNKMNVEKKSSIIFNKRELENLIKISKKLNKLDALTKFGVLKDGWEFIIKTEEKTFNFYDINLNDSNIELKNIVEELKKLSPIKINLHGWS
jgi:hypothetical protein